VIEISEKVRQKVGTTSTPGTDDAAEEKAEDGPLVLED
jgi:hypothetical protein